MARIPTIIARRKRTTTKIVLLPQKRTNDNQKATSDNQSIDKVIWYSNNWRSTQKSIADNQLTIRLHQKDRRKVKREKHDSERMNDTDPWRQSRIRIRFSHNIMLQTLDIPIMIELVDEKYRKMIHMQNDSYAEQDKWFMATRILHNRSDSRKRSTKLKPCNAWPKD
jgi:hypothetical protein